MTTKYDQNTAGEYDVMILLDHSSSMNKPSTRFTGKTRWQEVRESAYGIASEVAQFDSDGVDMIMFGGQIGIKMTEGVTPEKIDDVFSQRPNGSTPLTGALEMVFAKQARTKKNTVAVIFTDGEPDDRPGVKRSIINAANKLDRDEAVTLLFVQVGNDPDAASFLKELDDKLDAKYDIVDTISAEAAEKLSALDMINAAIGD